MAGVLQVSCNLLTKDSATFPVQFPLLFLKKFRTCVKFIKESLQEILHYPESIGNLDIFPVYIYIYSIYLFSDSGCLA